MLVVVNAAGSVLLGLTGLSIAFVLNTASYLVAAATLWGIPEPGPAAAGAGRPLSIHQVFVDLADGFAHLRQRPALLYPLLQTFALITITGPVLGLLAAIVHAQSGSIVDLGMLTTAFSLGALGGAGFAGARDDGAAPSQRYALLGAIAAAALALFVYLPIGLASLAPLAVLGFISFAEAVWNTSRVRRIAAPAYQARLQAITSMAFTLRVSIGILWGGVAIDWLGLTALLGGAAALMIFSIAASYFIIAPRTRSTD